MTVRRMWSAFALVLFPACLAIAADDAYGDPVPEGAKLRLGTARLRNTSGNPNAMTPNGRFLAASLPSGAIGFLDERGDVTRSVRIDGQFGTVVAFSADTKRALSSGYQGAFVWDTGTGKVLAKAARENVTSDSGLSFAGDGKSFAVGGSKGFNEKDKDKLPTAIVWDVDGNKQITSVTPQQNQTVSVALSPDGKRLATWGYHYDQAAKEQPKPEADPARLVQFWNAADGKETAKVRVLTGSNPTLVSFSPDASVAAVSNGESTVLLVDPATGASKGVLLGRSRQGKRLAFSPDGKTLAAAGDDLSIQRWNVADGKRLETTESPVPTRSSLRGLQFTDNERVVAWATRGSASFIWESPTGKLLTPSGGHFNPVVGAAVAGGGKEIFTSSVDGLILRWDPVKGKELGSLPLKNPEGGYGPGLVSGMVVLTPDGTRALASEGNGIAIYDLPSGTQQYVIPGDLNRENRGSFSSDGSKVVQLMTSYDAKKNPARVALWDVAGAKKLGEFELPELVQVNATLSPDGKTIVTAGIKAVERGEGDFVVAGWEVGTGKKRGEFTEPGGYGSMSVAATGDNKTAVVMSPKSGPIVVDFVSGAKVRDLDLGGKPPGGSLAVSPDGKLAAVSLRPSFGATPTSTLLVIDIETGKVKKTLTGISGNQITAVFSPDSKTLITGSSDTTALVWDVAEK